MIKQMLNGLLEVRKVKTEKHQIELSDIPKIKNYSLVLPFVFDLPSALHKPLKLCRHHEFSVKTV